MTNTETHLPYRRVLVPLDGSEFAAAAVSTGRALAKRLGADLHTVSVANDDADANQLRAHAAAVVGLDDGDERLHVVVGGPPAEVIERHAHELEPALVCMSTHGRGRVVGAVMGSAAREILQRLRDPIVAVGPSAERGPVFVSRKSPAPLPVPLSVPRLVACVDGSGPSEQLLPVALTWAQALGMSLSIVMVADAPAPFRPEARDYVAQLADQWQGRADNVTAELLSDPLSPADGLRAHLDVHPAGLVAVTTHAREGLHRLRLGATAANIVRVAAVPTLVVPLT